MHHQATWTRFWDKVELDLFTGCWLWTAARHENGYGVLRIDGRNRGAHRVSYELHCGPIPEGLVIDHVRARGCVHRHCVNPDHLEAVTQRENIMRGDSPAAVAAKRTECSYGHPLKGENLSLEADGSRRCRICRLAAADASRRADGVPLGNAHKQHCPAGHPYDDVNTRVEFSGGHWHRKCRTCERERARVRREARRRLSRD